MAMMRPSVQVEQRKVKFTSRELNELLAAVSKRRKDILCGAAAGQDQWAAAWQEVAQEVSLVEGINRTDRDVRKKWTYLKWEAMNTTKPDWDSTSKAVLNILKKEGGKQRRYKTRKFFENSKPLKELLPKSFTSTNYVRPHMSHKKMASSVDDEDSSLCIKWNTYASNMSTVIPTLLAEEKFVDVTLACDSRYIKCHKVILSAGSLYFERLLSCNPCHHPVILMKDFKFWQIEAIVDFIYKGVINIPQSKLPKLLQAANALNIKGLMSNKNDEGTTLSEHSMGDCSSDSLPNAPNIRPSSVGPAKRKAQPRTTTLRASCSREASDSEVFPHRLPSNVIIKEEPLHENWAEFHDNSTNSGQFEVSWSPDRIGSPEQCCPHLQQDLAWDKQQSNFTMKNNHSQESSKEDAKESYFETKPFCTYS